MLRCRIANMRNVKSVRMISVNSKEPVMNLKQN